MFSASDAISDRDETLWLAGLLEGEGSFAAYVTKAGATRPQLRVTLNMCDLDVVERAARIVGGNARISRRERPRPEWSAIYTIQWTGADAETIMRRVLPFMGARRAAKIEESLAVGVGHHRKTHCIRGHAFDEANTRREGNARKCRTCERERSRRRKRKQRSA